MRHPKFLRLAHALGSIHLARGALEIMWEVGYESGDPRLGSPRDVEAAAQWRRGQPGRLFEALRDAGGPGRAGFVEEDPAGSGLWKIHDLLANAPDFVQRRMRREVARRLKGLELEAELSGHRPVSDPSLTRAPAPAPAPAPAQKKLAGTPQNGAPPPLPQAWLELSSGTAASAGPPPPPGSPPSPPAKNGHTAPEASQRLKPLTDQLVALYAEVRGEKYKHGGAKDASALKRLLPVADDATILGRWRFGLSALGWQRISTLAQLDSKWNDLSTSATAPDVKRGRVDAAASLGMHGEGDTTKEF